MYYEEFRHLLRSSLDRRSHYFVLHLLERVVLWVLGKRYLSTTVERNYSRIFRAMESIKRQACLDVLQHTEG